MLKNVFFYLAFVCVLKPSGGLGSKGWPNYAVLCTWWGVFALLEKLSFWGPWDLFFPKTLGKPREVKNGLIVLKFDTLIDW